MIRCVIIDDEFHCIETLQVLLDKAPFLVNVLASFSDTDRAIQFLSKNEIDILFIDIQMPKLNGFEFVEKVVSDKVSVIFTTSYSDYAIKAYKIAAFGYLMKPIAQKELNLNLERWLKENQTRDFKKMQLDKIALPSRDGAEIIALCDVVFCKSDNNYTLFNLANDKRILICRTIKSVSETLATFGFVRVHQSYLVNTEYITKLSKLELTLNNDKIVPISKTYFNDLNKFFIQINK